MAKPPSEAYRLWGGTVILLWLISNAITGVDGQCLTLDPRNPEFTSVVSYSSNKTMLSTDCTSKCTNLKFLFAAIEDASYCFCGNVNTGLLAASTCTTMCTDSVACGGPEVNVVSSFPLAPATGTLEIGITSNVAALLVGSMVTISVNASDSYKVHWGDGSTPVLSSVQHAYSLPGIYRITAFLVAMPTVRALASVVVHDSPSFAITCPEILQLNVSDVCVVDSLKQGDNFQVNWNMTNSSFINGFLAEIPSEIINIFGSELEAADVVSSSAITAGTLVLMENTFVKNGGELVRVRAQVPAGSGVIGVYAVSPTCATNSYCGATGLCTTACPVPNSPYVCADSLCSSFAVCKSFTCPSSAPTPNTYAYTLLTTVTVTAAAFDYVFPVPVPVPAGAQLAFGCATTDAACATLALLNLRPVGADETGDRLLDITAAPPTISPTATKHLLEFVVRRDDHINLNFSIICEVVAPISNAIVPTPYSAITEDYVYQSDLTLTYNILTPLVDTSASLFTQKILCQQQILPPTLSELEVWMKYGYPYPFIVSFTQGSPLFSTVDIDSVINYYYLDAVTPPKYDLTFDLVYAQEGLFHLSGNTSNALGYVLYNATVHVVPEVTNNWKLAITCLCLDFEEGFPFELALAAAPHPPWNATFNVTYGTTPLFPEELIDFQTFGANGAAVPLTITKSAVILQKGIYTVTVTLENEVSNTTLSTTIEVKEAIRDVSAAMFWEYGGTMMPGIGASQNMFLANHTFHLYPKSRTGIPDMWRFIINETGQVFTSASAAENFTYIFPEEGDFTIIVSGYNSVQGWVDSPPIPIKIVFKLQGFVLTDNRVVTKPNELKVIIGDFLVFTPMSCVIIDYGDGSEHEAFGYQPVCEEKYPNTKYMGESLAPVNMPHNYTEDGIYLVRGMAFDRDGFFTQELSVTVGDVPCTMPLVSIVDWQKIPDSAPEYFMSLSANLQGEAVFQCNTSIMVIRWWNISQIDPQTTIAMQTVEIENILSTWDASQLTITPRFLEYGTYLLTYNIRIIPIGSNLHLERNDFTYIKIVPSPLIPALVSGSTARLRVGFGNLVTLYPGTLSYDPDYPNEKITNLTLWCHQLSPTAETVGQNPDGSFMQFNEHNVATSLIADQPTLGEGCFGVGPGVITMDDPSIVQINSGFLRHAEAEFRFVLEIRKDLRTAYTTLVLQVTLERPPIMNIECDQRSCWPSGNVLIINPTQRLGLRGSCTTDCGVDSGAVAYQWSIVSKLGTPVDESSVTCGSSASTSPSIDATATDCQETFITPKNGTDLAISPIFFTNNNNIEEYVIRLSGITDEGQEGFSEILIKVNKPPAGGSCIILDKVGESLISIYPAESRNWVDPEEIGIESYSYYYFQETNTGKIRKTLATTLKNSLDLIMPVGKYEIFVAVTDKLLSTTEHRCGNVTVDLPTKEQVDAYNPIEMLKYLANVGDSTTLGMVIVAYSSIQNASDWLSLDSQDIANMTEEELTARISEIAKLNKEQIELLLNTSEITTLGQLNSVSAALQSILQGLHEGTLSSQTIDLPTRDSAIALLKEMTIAVPKLNVTSPQELVPFLSNSMDIMSGLIKGVNNILTTKDVPPTDMENAGDLPYDTDIGFDINMEIPANQQDMFKENVYDTTKYKSRGQLDLLFSCLNTIVSEMESKCVVGETVVSHSPNGASMVISKIQEKALEPGLAVDVSSNLGAKVYFPKKFCPSSYELPNTDCNQVITLVIAIWPCITHLYPDSSNVLANNTRIIDVGVDFKGNKIKITNESRPIIITIPDVTSLLPSPFHVNASDERSDLVPLVYHSFNISSEGSAYSIEISPDKPIEEKRMVLLLDYERMPTPGWHTKRVLLNQLPRSKGFYRYLVKSAENNNKTGRFFFAVGLLKSDFNLAEVKNLTSSNFVSDFNIDYSYRVYVSGCYFFDLEDVNWKGKGVYAEEFDPNITICATSHLTPFGVGFVPSPNVPDFDYIFAHTGFLDNLTIYIVLILLTCLYIIMMIWGHWMDRKDIERRGVIPLPDNDSKDKYLYEITFNTGPDSEATTDSNIYFILSGDYEETEVRSLPPANGRLYRRFGITSFVMATPRPLGPLNYLRVFHDNSGEPPLDTWQLQLAIVRDLQKAEKFIFDINTWLAFNRDEGKVDKTFNVYTGQDERTFTQNMYLKGNRAANQDHMWMAMFLRPIGSRFGRKERVSVCAAYLYLSILVDAFWLQSTPDHERDPLFSYARFNLTFDSLIAACFIVLLVYPIIYLMIMIFKRARPKNLKKCRALESIEKQRTTQLLQQNMTLDEAESQSKVEIIEGTSPKPKDVSYVKCLPWWTRVLAWIIILCAIAGSVFFIWSFGIMWGESKTTTWLSSFIVTFFISILFSQWLKVLIASVFSATLCKKDMYTEDIDCDEELPELKQDEQWQHPKPMDPSIRKRVHRVEGVDIEDPETNVIRDRLMKEREIGFVLRGILAYCCFLVIIYVLAGSRVDDSSYQIKNHLVNSFIRIGSKDYDFSNLVRSSEDWWLWAKNVILQELRVQPDYNGAQPYGLKGYLDDRANRIMGYAIIRQIRSQRFSCNIPGVMRELVPHCSGLRGISNEDTADYCAKWQYNESFPGSCRWREFKYVSPQELGTYTYSGRIGHYSGGGYVFRLSGRQDVLLQRMDELQKHAWIDENTRAVILEFSVYNVNVNLFVICTVTSEFYEGGGAVTKYRFDPIRLIKYDGIKGFIVTVAEFLFVAATIFFTLRELWQIKKQRLRYFDSYWNVAEICILFVSYAAIGIYIYRAILTQEALNIFDETFGNGYIRMDSAGVLDEFYVYTTATIIFFSTLKLIKLLQFNKKMDVLALTIRICWDDLKMFFVAFGIVFFGFSCLFFFMFTEKVEDFAEILRAIMTSFKMMMGKFDFEEMNQANPISPLLFFIFSVTNSMVLINIMLTIILQAFSIVKNDLASKENRLNVIDFVWTSIRQVIRAENLPKIHVEPKFTDKVEKNPNYVAANDIDADHLPDKVSHLLKYINDVYFEGRLDLRDPNSKKSLMMEDASQLKRPVFKDLTKSGQKVLNSEG